MAQPGEPLPCSPDILTPTLRTCMKVGREPSPPNCPLPRMCCGIHGPALIHMVLAHTYNNTYIENKLLDVFGVSHEFFKITYFYKTRKGHYFN